MPKCDFNKAAKHGSKAWKFHGKRGPLDLLNKKYLKKEKKMFMFSKFTGSKTRIFQGFC